MQRRGLCRGLIAGTLAVGCGTSRSTPHDSGPRLRVLGIAQDGGLPHPACSCVRCETARRHPSARRHVASLALDSGDGRVALIDATPDLPDQLAMIRDLRRARRKGMPTGRVDRRPLDAVFLTHAHIGHYAGLGLLGFEAVSAQRIALHATSKLRAYLEANDPWKSLVKGEHLVPSTAEPGRAIAFGALSVTPVAVPHRDELSDTVGYRIEGPRQTVLYVPDCKPWEQWSSWPHSPESLLEGVDVALLDGTFYSLDELPGRDVTETGHPLMRDTMERFASQVASGMTIQLIHLNHSNPALSPGSAARLDVQRRGYAIATEGADVPL